jgi:hypothetical protein
MRGCSRFLPAASFMAAASAAVEQVHLQVRLQRAGLDQAAVQRSRGRRAGRRCGNSHYTRR